IAKIQWLDQTGTSFLLADDSLMAFPLLLGHGDQRDRYYPKCRVCGLDFWVKDHLWVYKCEKCWYYAHLNCATSRTEPFMSILSSSGLGKKTKNYIDAQHPDLLHLPFTDQNHSIQKHMLSRVFGSESSARTHEGDLEHIIHQHPLILVDAQSKQMTMSTSSDIKPLPCHDPIKKTELLCNACVRPIMDVPYYMCSYEDQHCNFVIHEWFSGDVNKYINIKFRGTHSIKDHPHPDLSFVQGLASDGNCARCDMELQYELIFKCSQCKFAIDYDCCKALSSYRDEDEDYDDDELSNSNSD
nr:hypothetical protein [Tanacetum cinerariifolium]